MLHLFLRLPSVVLSGEDGSIASLSGGSPKSRSPTSPENGLRKKSTSFQETSVPAGFIQYWSERLSPRDSVRISVGQPIPSSSSRYPSPLRLSGMQRPVHHSFKACLSPPFFVTVPIGMWSGVRMDAMLEIPECPMSRSATSISPCIRV